MVEFLQRPHWLEVKRNIKNAVSWIQGFLGSWIDIRRSFFEALGTLSSRKNGKKNIPNPQNLSITKMSTCQPISQTGKCSNSTEIFTTQGLEEVKLQPGGQSLHNNNKKIPKRLEKNSYDSVDLILARAPRTRCVYEPMFLPSLFL